MRRFTSVLSFVITLFSYSSIALAETPYYWVGPNNPRAANPMGACNPSVSNATLSGIEMQPGGAGASCVYTYTDSKGNPQTLTTGTVSRGGDYCPSGTEFDSTTGICKSSCSSTTGTTGISLSAANKLTGGVIPVNNKMCNNSCQFVYTSGGSTDCGALKANPDSYYCIFKYTGNGQACDGSEEAANSGAPDTSVPPKDPNDPTDPANNCPKGYSWSGTTCVKYWEDEKEPTTTPPPNPGTGTGGGGGSGGGSGGGAGGGDTGTGDAPPPGTGNGSGGGAGEGKDEDKDIEASSSQDCKKPPACDGDVFSCAILNQNYFDSCRMISLPTDKEKAGRDQEIKKQNDIMQEGQEVLDSQVSGFLSKFMAAGGGGFGGGKCYPDKQVSIGGRTIQLPFSQICDPLIILRYGLLAAAYLAAARILSKETT
ncbi:hypothetical protein NLO72_17065 [Pseudomonas tremae]|uniref:virulence factor TspB C-terminal domain-related protein n=1 Tax=Pseudomonas tremae TaxID=200454 RepID=UPI0021086945|nr:virulence factor TspB C-terminal domain-related protein [Pseudomonas tremae]MCQ2990929.1 hypothetical protein [Pseudomonas tremae]